VGARTSNVAQLKECTAALTARAPNDPKTISYLWALAMADGRTGDADDLVRRASAAGVAPEDIQRMKKATADAAMKRSLRVTALTVGIGLLLAGIVVAVRALWARRRREANAVAGTAQQALASASADARG
jgi:hypothetical protein